MSRIRSIYPEQWTDEDFVTCSPLARLLAIAIRNEADDNGVFEWKPIAIKMRLLPADDCDVSALLGELVSTNQVYRFEVNGKKFGAIRNFTTFQKPKTPKYKYPEPPPFPQNGEIALVQQPPVPPKEEINLHMEGRGEEKESKGKVRATKPQFVIDDDFRAWAKKNAPLVESIDAELDAYRDWQRCNQAAKDEAAGFRNWLRRSNGYAAERAAKEMMARARAGDRVATVERMATALSPDESWRNTMRFYRKTGKWIRNVDGPPPGDPNCRVPQHILDEFKDAA